MVFLDLTSKYLNQFPVYCFSTIQAGKRVDDNPHRQLFQISFQVLMIKQMIEEVPLRRRNQMESLSYELLIHL